MAYRAFANVDPKSLATYVPPSGFSMAVKAIGKEVSDYIKQTNKENTANKRSQGNITENNIFTGNNKKRLKLIAENQENQIGGRDKDSTKPVTYQTYDVHNTPDDKSDDLNDLDYYQKPDKSKYTDNKQYREAVKVWKTNKGLIKNQWKMLRDKAESKLEQDIEKDVEGLAKQVKFGTLSKRDQKKWLFGLEQGAKFKNQTVNMLTASTSGFVNPNSPMGRFSDILQTNPDAKVYTVGTKTGIEYRVYDPRTQDFAVIDASLSRSAPVRGNYPSDSQYKEAVEKWAETGGGLWGTNDLQKTGSVITGLINDMAKKLPGDDKEANFGQATKDYIKQDPNNRNQILGLMRNAFDDNEITYAKFPYLDANNNERLDPADFKNASAFETKDFTDFLSGINDEYNADILRDNGEEATDKALSWLADVTDKVNGVYTMNDEEYQVSAQNLRFGFPHTGSRRNDDGTITITGVKPPEGTTWNGLEKLQKGPNKGGYEYTFNPKDPSDILELAKHLAVGENMKLDTENLHINLDTVIKRRYEEFNPYFEVDAKGNKTSYSANQVVGPTFQYKGKQHTFEENVFYNDLRRLKREDLNIYQPQNTNYNNKGTRKLFNQNTAPPALMVFKEASNYFLDEREKGVRNPVIPKELFSGTPKSRAKAYDNLKKGLPPGANQIAENIPVIDGLDSRMVTLISDLDGVNPIMKSSIASALIDKVLNKENITKAVNGIKNMASKVKNKVIDVLNGYDYSDQPISDTPLPTTDEILGTPAPLPQAPRDETTSVNEITPEGVVTPGPEASTEVTEVTPEVDNSWKRTAPKDLDKDFVKAKKDEGWRYSRRFDKWIDKDSEPGEEMVIPGVAAAGTFDITQKKQPEKIAEDIETGGWKWSNRFKRYVLPEEAQKAYEDFQDNVGVTGENQPGAISERPAVATDYPEGSPQNPIDQTPREPVKSVNELGSTEGVKRLDVKAQAKISKIPNLAEGLKENVYVALANTPLTTDNYEKVKDIVWDKIKYGPKRGEVMEALGYDSNGIHIETYKANDEISDRLIKHIQRWESGANPKDIQKHLTAYLDPASKREYSKDDPRYGKPITVGYGSTLDINGKSFKLGQKISLDMANKLFKRDVLKAKKAVQKLGLDLTPGQIDALTSLKYNLTNDGWKNLIYGDKRVPPLRTPAQIGPKIVQYLKASGGDSVKKGLLGRRKDETKIFNSK